MSKALLAAIDKELARLQVIRRALIHKEKTNAGKGSRSGAAKKGARRQLSSEARARIAEAQRKRWAAVRKEKNKQTKRG